MLSKNFTQFVNFEAQSSGVNQGDIQDRQNPNITNYNKYSERRIIPAWLPLAKLSTCSNKPQISVSYFTKQTILMIHVTRCTRCVFINDIDQRIDCKYKLLCPCHTKKRYQVSLKVWFF